MNRRTALELTAAGLLGAGTLGAARPAAAEVARPASFRGVNIPGWATADEPRPVAPEVLQELRLRGFDSVRLPVDGDTLAFGDAAAVARTISNLGSAMTTLVEAGYAVMVDLHPAGELAGLLARAPAEGGRAAMHAWQTLRETVAEFPVDRVFAELLNEPPMAQEDWLPLRRALADTVRERCPDHAIVWGAARFQGTWETVETPPLDDGNAMAAVHFYWPMVFTHQCASWLGPPLSQLSGVAFPDGLEAAALADIAARLRAEGEEAAIDWLDEQFASEWRVSAIGEEFARVRQWSEANGCPVILNEFGVLKSCAPAASRALWTHAVREAAERNGMGWLYWELDAGFGFLDAREDPAGLDSGMLAALLD